MTKKFAFDPPKTYFRGENPGDARRISTGDENWDSHLFVTSTEGGAKLYGSQVSRYEPHPDAKILVEGSPEHRKLTRGVKGSLLDVGSETTRRAKKAGYDAVHFSRQTDMGTAILNRDKFRKV